MGPLRLEYNNLEGIHSYFFMDKNILTVNYVYLESLFDSFEDPYNYIIQSNLIDEGVEPKEIQLIVSKIKVFQILKT